MEFSVPQNDLLDCLNHFQSVVERRNTIPILSNIKIVASKGFLSVTATDLAMELTEKIKAKVTEDGGVTVPSQLFFDIVRKAPNKSEISLKKDKKTETVSDLILEDQFILFSYFLIIVLIYTELTSFL